MEDYQIEAVERLLQRRILPVQGDVPGAAQAFWLNHRLEKFQDPRVRQALALAFDFESMNRDFFYGAYERLHSYYYWSSDYRAEGPPDADELAILEPFRDQYPPRYLPSQRTATRYPKRPTIAIIWRVPLRCLARRVTALKRACCGMPMAWPLAWI